MHTLEFYKAVFSPFSLNHFRYPPLVCFLTEAAGQPPDWDLLLCLGSVLLLPSQICSSHSVWSPGLNLFTPTVSPALACKSQEFWWNVFLPQAEIVVVPAVSCSAASWQMGSVLRPELASACFEEGSLQGQLWESLVQHFRWAVCVLGRPLGEVLMSLVMLTLWLLRAGWLEAAVLKLWPEVPWKSHLVAPRGEVWIHSWRTWDAGEV